MNAGLAGDFQWWRLPESRPIEIDFLQATARIDWARKWLTRIPCLSRLNSSCSGRTIWRESCLYLSHTSTTFSGLGRGANQDAHILYAGGERVYFCVGSRRRCFVWNPRTLFGPPLGWARVSSVYRIPFRVLIRPEREAERVIVVRLNLPPLLSARCIGQAPTNCTLHCGPCSAIELQVLRGDVGSTHPTSKGSSYKVAAVVSCWSTHVAHFLLATFVHPTV